MSRAITLPAIHAITERVLTKGVAGGDPIRKRLEGCEAAALCLFIPLRVRGSLQTFWEVTGCVLSGVGDPPGIGPRRFFCLTPRHGLRCLRTRHKLARLQRSPPFYCFQQPVHLSFSVFSLTTVKPVNTAEAQMFARDISDWGSWRSDRMKPRGQDRALGFVPSYSR